MLNVLGVTSCRTPLGFDRRFRKLHFGMEKDPPDARRLLFASQRSIKASLFSLKLQQDHTVIL